MKPLGQMDARPWHPYLTHRLPQDLFYPRPRQPHEEPSEAESTGGAFFALAAVAGLVLLLVAWSRGK